MKQRVILGLSGASGAALGLSVARQLAQMETMIDLVVSPAAERTLAEECGAGALDELRALAAVHYDVRNIGASIASGSVPVAGMIVAPCSMRSLAAIANGLDDNLLTRAAGVQLKERRKLVLLAREAPLTLAHLRNMTAATEMGAIVLPPVPAFYLKPSSVDDIVTQIAARAIDLLRLGSAQAQAWSET
ncbi:putative UbiX-like flavin prenyltransferase [Aliiroseovarius sp. xm-m-379]|uniref:UbiX family flavin prenyltransferase n=1 Tax=unclassified Aliiroseovarius TaxID=2623558 RepID=UPI0015691200|nr:MULTISPECIES: UbiX family flavin prenyltransferase [unclassified Aliiroseovarius]NRP12640.1 putative UbiX-like flavin prenyltransferase [Aliiroseovarius sp. xm-d-517]NRP24527.1 putative UbiX-like flavin prenyltransferase [Aliiroseovarius sp. xm-m-379]NRP29663.1 putative UbiX-like flavin prenyltransferase [Aliiroseovarius sp. xm-m-314]NRP33326.1 putative UbiX-like flavin prenyltransferase [Aliiroseovarius sp. xm-a-104]NRP39673.1 putative UbiX-like flavin prenyltransferase [Aliiroseovarius sp